MLLRAQNADRIVVVANGRVEEQGTHEELLKRGKHYDQLMSSNALFLGNS